MIFTNIFIYKSVDFPHRGAIIGACDTWYQPDSGRFAALAAGLGFLVLALDIAKGTAAVWLADRGTGGSMFWMTLAALAVIAGHAFPVFLRFQGGKAVASFIGNTLDLELAVVPVN